MVSYGMKIQLRELSLSGLNPCCNGRWSHTTPEVSFTVSDELVLILVVMEDGLILTIKKS